MGPKPKCGSLLRPLFRFSPTHNDGRNVAKYAPLKGRWPVKRQPSDDLRELPLFEKLPKKSLVMADSLMTSVTFDTGEVMCAAGKFGLEVFILVSGSAKVSRASEVIATVGPGDVIGEIAILDTTRRSASVTATEPVTALVMTAQEFASLRSLPGVDDAVRQIAANRLAADAATSSA